MDRSAPRTVNEQRSRTEADILGVIWETRQNDERFAELAEIKALALRGQFPDTTLEITWRDLMSTSAANDVMVFKLWPRGQETPVDIDARVEADNILGDLHLRALGD